MAVLACECPSSPQPRVDLTEPAGSPRTRVCVCARTHVAGREQVAGTHLALSAAPPCSPSQGG